VVFSTINYGTDTSAEGRCIIRETLNATYASLPDEINVQGVNSDVTLHVPTTAGFTIEMSDSVPIHYGEADSVSVAILAPGQVLSVRDEWDGLYREEQIVPFWKYIKSITVGDDELPDILWNNEPAWHLNTEGGKRYQGESRHYILALRDK